MKHILNSFSPLAYVSKKQIVGPQQTNILKKYIGFCREREQSSRFSGGVAIIVQTGVAERELKLNPRLEVVAATVASHKTIYSLYLAAHLTVTLYDLEDLFEQLPEPYLVVGDFNAHSWLGGSDKTDTRGQILEDFNLTIFV